MLKLGKTPARPGAVKLRFKDYLKKAKLPTPPASFGHEAAVHEWGMLGNDKYGDCVWAGAGHEHVMLALAGGMPAVFTESNVLAGYSAVTGFDWLDPSTDQGTDMELAAKYRRKTGLIDSHRRRHKITAYLAIEPGNVAEHLAALYLLGAVGIGIEFPASAMDQFNAGKPWTVVAKSKIEGGHYVPLVARRDSTHLSCVTWGKVQPMAETFFKKYNDESIAYVNPDLLNRTTGKTPEGFDVAALLDDLKQFTPA